MPFAPLVIGSRGLGNFFPVLGLLYNQSIGCLTAVGTQTSGGGSSSALSSLSDFSPLAVSVSASPSASVPSHISPVSESHRSSYQIHQHLVRGAGNSLRCAIDQATESDDEFAQDFLEDGGDGDYDDGDDYGDDY